MSEGAALTFAFAMTVISLLTFWIFTNPLATGLTVAAISFYVFGYTVGLKRRTSQNIVWGGIAGCMPVLIGWAAVTGTLSLTAWLFFLLIFFWTPPHFWALAIKYRDDYERAGVPMLPVVAPMKSVVAQMWFHSTAMVITSYAFLLSVGVEPWIYLLATAINALFLFSLIKMRGDSSQIEAAAIKVFKGSITYLTLFSILLIPVALL
jgi:protoheme IX farnesyltransferase